MKKCFVTLFLAAFSALSTLAVAETSSSSKLLKLKSGPKVSIKELPFGEVLFHYYQKNYFAALTRLDVAFKRNETIEHRRELELIQGVMYLSYGMLESAETIFVRLLSEESQDQQLAQVRFYLAKIHYLNGHFPEAMKHFNIALKWLPKELLDETYLILGQIYSSQQNIEQAKLFYSKISESSLEGKFARFNLAMYLLQQDQAEPALELIETLYPKQSSTDIERSLFDKANIALGYFYLEKNNIEEAREYLLRTRLNGPFSNRAILALGWAYAESGLKEKAVGHWRELLKRDKRDPAVQEAAMAIAFSYYHYGSKQIALESFVNAAAFFGEQLTLLSDAKEQLKEKLFNDWLEDKSVYGDKIFEKWQVGDVPVTHSAVEYYLQEVTSTNEFNQIFHRYQEMTHLELVLARWKRQIPVYSQMLENHQLRYMQLKPSVEMKSEALLEGNMSKQYHELRKKIDTQLSTDDLWLFANESELEIKQDTERLEQSIASLPSDEFDMEDQIEQLRRIKGATLWNIASSYGPRKYQVQKLSKDIEEALVLLKKQSKKMKDAEKVASSRFLNYDSRISDITIKIDLLLNSVASIKENARKNMELVLVERLEKREKEIAFLLAQTELSIAKIQDEAVNLLLEKTQ